ncbi:hypothetical protein NHF46_16000 [Arthrobacter alpinus]|nr:hypothetical protein [Arthrobacter alpinus]
MRFLGSSAVGLATSWAMGPPAWLGGVLGTGLAGVRVIGLAVVLVIVLEALAHPPHRLAERSWTEPAGSAKPPPTGSSAAEIAGSGMVGSTPPGTTLLGTTLPRAPASVVSASAPSISGLASSEGEGESCRPFSDCAFGGIFLAVNRLAPRAALRER